jgi:hypothetical protein
MQSQHFRETKFLSYGETKTLDAMDISRHYGYSIQCVVANKVTAISAALKLQCSNDGTSFSDIASATLTIADNGVQMLNLAALNYRFVRAVITYTSGEADITILENSKGS